MNETTLKVVLIDGTEQTLSIDMTKEVVITYANGESKSINITKAAPRSRVDINEMTVDELRQEIRNSHSVYYKNKKKLEELNKDTVANADAIAKFDTAKLEEQKARFEAADKLFETKFPGQAKAVGSKEGSTTKTPKASPKVTAIENMIETISAAALPDDQKKETLDKLNALLEQLKPKAKKETKTAEVAPAEDNTAEAPVENPVKPGRFN